jgi:predicted Zn-dependent peptidase
LLLKGTAVETKTFLEEPITKTIKANFEDPNIQIPMVVAAYRTPSMKTRDARVLDFISTILSDGKAQII